MKQKLFEEWNTILTMERCTPYVFRTRLERTINSSKKYAQQENNHHLFHMVNELLEKLQYIADHSNQTSDGCLNSFIVLRDDILEIKEQFA